MTTVPSDHEPMARRVLKLIAQRGSLSVPELMVALGESREEMTQAIHSLRKFGSVETFNVKRDGYMPYRATEKGLERLRRREEIAERRVARARDDYDPPPPPRNWEPLEVARRVPSFVFNLGAMA